MLVACPKCQAKLNVPEAAVGKKVRCPKCQEVFAAAAPAAPAAEVRITPAPPPVEMGRPKVAAERRRPSTDEDDEEEDDVPRRRRRAEEDDEADDRPRARRARDDEDEDDDLPRRRRRRDEEDEGDEGDEDELGFDRRRAVAKSRGAALAMYIALVPYVLSAVINIAMMVAVQPALGGPPQNVNANAFRFGQMAGAYLCGPMITLTFVALIALGANSLRNFKSRGLVITAIVLMFLAVLGAGFRTVINALVLLAPNIGVNKVWPISVAACEGLTAVCMLIGALLAIVALVDGNVRAAYADRRRR